MSHLIQPVSIDGTKHCIKHGATTPKWRTVSIRSGLVNLVATEDDDKWVGAGSYKFATSCFRKFTITFTPDPIGAVFSYIILINGIQQATGGGIDVVIDEIDLNTLGLMGRACGNVFEILLISLGGSVPVTAEITDVTFGAPV